MNWLLGWLLSDLVTNNKIKSTSASWFDNLMINHEMSLKVNMFFETFLVIFGD